MSILEEFYYGNLDLSAQFVKDGSEYQKLTAKLSDRMDEFIALLNEDEKGRFDQIYEMLAELNCISERERFIYGFRLGAQITWDVFGYISPNFTQ